MNRSFLLANGTACFVFEKRIQSVDAVCTKFSERMAHHTSLVQTILLFIVDFNVVENKKNMVFSCPCLPCNTEIIFRTQEKNNIHFRNKFLNVVQTIRIEPWKNQVRVFEELNWIQDWVLCDFRSKRFQNFAFCWLGPCVYLRFPVAAITHRNIRRSKSTPNKAHHGRIMFTKCFFLTSSSAISTLCPASSSFAFANTNGRFRLFSPISICCWETEK